MREQKLPGILAAVDASKEIALSSKYKIKGFPTLKHFSFGQYKLDVNVRDVESIIKFMKNPTEPPPPPPAEKPWSDEETNVMHLNEENFKSYLKKKKHVLVMFYTDCKWISFSNFNGIDF